MSFSYEKMMKEQIKKAIENYNKIAKVYADHTSEKLLQFQLNKFISLLPKSAKVLDIGSGSGRDMAYLQEEGINVIGIDISDGLIKEAKSRFNNLNIQKIDFRKTSFKASEFNGLWCMASLSDIQKAEAPKTLKEFHRILKKEGILYIAVKEGTEEKIIKKTRYNTERFYSFYTLPELELLLKNANFEILSAIVSQDRLTSWVEIFAKKL